ncbi:hypothetical protein CCACVL1_02757 [Corchorus capsularis]|uniref:Uncharacterized protein n=1 Tax=Corchorus capsularis TaxID=210143 RepID=A0A1R3H8B9_COCAP|nr:hypothetical protein CCACVL1_21078 [Corchorus capsularis]OMP02568.1 hypothetical protein CCACVL1_02757 [Corchorus capsularis]
MHSQEVHFRQTPKQFAANRDAARKKQQSKTPNTRLGTASKQN